MTVAISAQDPLADYIAEAFPCVAEYLWGRDIDDDLAVYSSRLVRINAAPYGAYTRLVAIIRGDSWMSRAAFLMSDRALSFAHHARFILPATGTTLVNPAQFMAGLRYYIRSTAALGAAFNGGR